MALKNISEEERRARIIRASRAKRDETKAELQEEKDIGMPKWFWPTLTILGIIGILFFAVAAFKSLWAIPIIVLPAAGIGGFVYRRYF